MAEKKIIICDRCRTRLTPQDPAEQEDITVVRAQRGDSRKLRDLCVVCADDLEQFFNGRALASEAKHVRESRAEDPEAQLVEVRRIAREAVIGWKDGGHAESLIEALTDIQTGARRR